MLLAKIAASNGHLTITGMNKTYHNYRDNKVQLAYVIVKGEIRRSTEAHGIQSTMIG